MSDSAIEGLLRRDRQVVAAVRRRRETATALAMRGKAYTLTRAAESYKKEHLSKPARGGEHWRILERESCPKSTMRSSRT